MHNAASKHWGIFKVCFAGAWIVLLVACAANPYSSVPYPKTQPGAATSPTIQLNEAMLYLEQVREDYRAKRSAEFDRQQNLSSGLFTLGAIGIGLGAYGAHRDAITGVALLGTTAYQASIWNTSAGRNQLYGEGITALDCAQRVMAPLYGSAYRYDAVVDAVRSLQDKRKATLDAMSTVSYIMLSQALTKEDRQTYKNMANAAEKQIRHAHASINSAVKFLALIESSGPDLKAQVQSIQDFVDKKMDGTLADPRNLQDAVNQLGGYRGFFSSIPNQATDAGSAVAAAKAAAGAAPTTQGASVIRVDAQNPLAVLIAASNELIAADYALSEIFRMALRSKNVSTDLGDCKVDAKAVAVGLQVEPAEIELKAGAAQTASVKISGGTGFYRTRLMTKSQNGISVTSPAGDVFDVSTTANSDAATYAVLVEDGTNASVGVTVVVKPAEQSAPHADKAVKPPSCSAIGYSPVAICLVQQAIGVEMDGKFGEKTCTAFRANALTASSKDLLDTPAMVAVKKKYGLAEDAGDEAMRGKLERACPPGAVAAPAPAPAPAAPAAPASAGGAPVVQGGKPSVAGSCTPPADPKQCHVKGALCPLECAMSVSQVLALRADKLHIADGVAEFDRTLRDALMARQRALHLAVQNGEYNQETAVALQNGK